MYCCLWEHGIDIAHIDIDNIQALDIMGFPLQDLGLRGVSIAGFQDFPARSAQNGAESAVLEDYDDLLQFFPDWCTQKALKLHFKDISDGPIFVTGRLKFFIFFPGRLKSISQRPGAHFFAKLSTIGPIMHKNEIKHEKLRFMGFSGAEKIFSTP